MASSFDGFVLFKENMTVFGTTAFAIPAIFSGETYQGDIEVASFVKETLSEKGFQNILFNKGYDVNLVPSITMPVKKFTNYYKPSRAYGGTRDQKDITEAATLMDLVLFRHMPNFLKKRIYNNQNWTIRPAFVSDKRVGYFYDKDFFEDYIETMQVKSSWPAYHFIHLHPPHSPFVTGEDCECAGEVLPPSKDNYKIEVKCILRLFIRFVEKLKILGIYDSTFIILQADHGKGFPVNMVNEPRLEKEKNKISLKTVGRSLALMAIKLPNKKGPLKISEAQTTVADIPSTVMDIIGFENPFKGISVFKIDPEKKRERWLGNRYKVTGSVYEYQSWKKEKSVLFSRQIIADTYKWGSAIQFGFLGNAQPYQTKGWAAAEDGFTWTVGKSASLSIPISMLKSPVTLKAKFRAALFSGKVDKQTVHILANGQEAGEWTITKPGFQEKDITIPKSLFTDPDRLVITFNLPDAASPAQSGVSGDNRLLGIAVSEITLHELGAEKEILTP